MEGNEVKLHEVVSQLVTDVEFVKNWKTLYQELPLKNIDIVSLENQWKNGTLQIHELLTIILTSWISCKGTNATVQVLHFILVSKNFILLAEKLQKGFPLESSIINTLNSSAICQYQVQPSHKLKTNIEVPHWFEVRPQAPNFVGREKELNQLDELCKVKKAKLILVAGMGGIGKTQLVIKFAKQFHTNQNGSVIWLQGQNEGSFINSVKRLTGHNKQAETDSDTETSEWLFNAFKNLHAKLKTNPTLIIIDNVDQRNLLVEFCIQKTKFLPPKNLPIVLVTSRKTDILGDVACTLNLGILSASEASTFVFDSLSGEPNRVDVNLLCKTLQCFPLALNQAVAYIRCNRKISTNINFAIDDYLDIYKNKKYLLLDHKLNTLESDYTLTTLTTWNITLESIKSQGKVGLVATNMLNILTYSSWLGLELHELNDLYVKLKLVPILKGDIIDDALQLLRSYSMCQMEVNYDNWHKYSSTSKEHSKSKMHYRVSIHRLLQQVIKLNNLKLKNTDFFKAVITKYTRYTRRTKHQLYHTILQKIWPESLKVENFVTENITALKALCLFKFRNKSRGLLTTNQFLKFVEEYNKSVCRIFRKENQKFVFVTQQCLSLTKPDIREDEYCQLVGSIYRNNKELLDRNSQIATDFAFIFSSRAYLSMTLIPTLELIKFYKFSVLYASDSYCFKITRCVLNRLDSESSVEKICEIQNFLCESYYQNKLRKRLVLPFLKRIEIALAVINPATEISQKSIDADDIEGILCYSKHLKHEQRYNSTRLFFKGNASFLNKICNHTNFALTFLQNLHKPFFNSQNCQNIYLAKSINNDPGCIEKSIIMLSLNLKANVVCAIDAYVVTHLMVAMHVFEGKQISGLAYEKFLGMTNEHYYLVDKFLCVVRYHKEICCKSKLCKQINFIRNFQVENRINILSRPKDKFATTGECFELLAFSEAHINESTGNDHLTGCESVQSHDPSYNKCNYSYTNWYPDSDTSDADKHLDSQNVLEIENGAFVWRERQRKDISFTTVFRKMKEAVLQDFEKAVQEALKSVKQSTDVDFRYETFWCAARLLFLKLDKVWKSVDAIEIIKKQLDFLEFCLQLTMSVNEKDIFLSTINYICFYLGKILHRNVSTLCFLVVLKNYEELNVVLLKNVIKRHRKKHIWLSELQCLIREVGKLIKQNSICIPKNGYTVIKLITLKVLKLGHVELSLTELMRAAKFLISDLNNENHFNCRNSFFIQISNKQLSFSDLNENQIPVDLAIAILYHILIVSESMPEQTLSLVERILIFLDQIEEFTEMVNIGRNAKILAITKTNNIIIHLIVGKITSFLEKAGKKYMVMRLQKPTRK